MLGPKHGERLEDVERLRHQQRRSHAARDLEAGELAARLEGELRIDDLTRTIYSTDASEYQERPLAVALPASEADVRELVRFAAAHRIGLVPRAAGTSLAGQVVGGGIASMAAATFLIRDAGMPGARIHILEELGLAGGCLDGGPAPTGDAWVTRGGRMLCEEVYQCLRGIRSMVVFNIALGHLVLPIWDGTDDEWADVDVAAVYAAFTEEQVTA